MRTLNVERRTSNVEVKTMWSQSFVRSKFKVRRWAFDVRLLLLLIAGCCPPPKPPDHTLYRGPTDAMETVIQQINENSGRIPTLWAQLDYSATLIDPERKHTDTVSGDGVLMYARPISLLLNGDKDVAGQVFELGSNNSEYWVKLRTGGNSYDYWWGHYSNLGKPGTRVIPIRPDLVVQVLGVGLYQTNLLQQPVPVMRFDYENDVYVFDLNVRNIDRWETLQEIWYDRRTKWPKRVLLYDDNGRAVLQADLSQHTAVKSEGVPREQWPMVARHYELLFPDSGSRITLDLLNDPELHHTTKHAVLPNDNSFQRVMPDENNRVIQVDEGVGGG